MFVLIASSHGTTADMTIELAVAPIALRAVGDNRIGPVQPPLQRMRVKQRDHSNPNSRISSSVSGSNASGADQICPLSMSGIRFLAALGDGYKLRHGLFAARDDDFLAVLGLFDQPREIGLGLMYRVTH